jgi:hypothetical protein
MSSEQVQPAIRATVLSYFRSIPSFAALSENDQWQCRYLERDVLDSLGIVGLIAELERAFDVQFSMDDLQSEEFRTPAGLVALVDRLKGSAR